jgi:DNA polymerase I-like protein with 3'-5' exonuclease and polymerase domains
MDINAEQLYNCKDCASTFEIWQEQHTLMQGIGYEQNILEKMEELNLSLDMTRAGFPFDAAEMQRQRTTVFSQMMQYESYFTSIISRDLLLQMRGKSAKAPWYRSPPQQMKLLYDILHFPEITTRATKRQAAHRTADDDALRKLEQLDPFLEPITRPLREYRSLANYYSNHLALETEPDGRLRSTFGLHPVNFRWNSKTNPYGRGGNLQNVPKGKDKS